ncbi:hypothetical protein [Variovorax sp. RCC_210]|uniref:hypothetical protein n=1 Tax=Variovorax sp. RCC_210 TaxID=3239217 RepID=UPI00352429A4
MAVTVKKAVVTALASCPANVLVASDFGGGYRVGGVVAGNFRFTDPGGPAAGRFGSTSPTRVDSASTGTVAPGVVTTFVMYDNGGAADIVADDLRIDTLCPTAGIYKVEFLNELDVVVGTYISVNDGGSVVRHIVPLSIPVTPTFWTALAGTREVA